MRLVSKEHKKFDGSTDEKIIKMRIERSKEIALEYNKFDKEV